MSHPSYFRTFILLCLLGSSCRFEPRGQSVVDAKLGANTDGGPSRAVPHDGPRAPGDPGMDGPAPAGAVCGNVCRAESSDGCCPVGCTAASDIDCVAQCGNGVLETGEQCDPPSACAASCPNRGCTKFTLEGSAAECTAICKEAGQEAACKSGDGCCPASCSVGDDDDCAVMCGNGAKEGNETCDPLASCPTACPAEGCQIRKLINPGTCSAECVNDRLQTACMPGDRCCPPGCHAGNDADCVVVCDNSIKESGETCDPLASCPTACPANECQIRKLINAGTCEAQCVNDRLQTSCMPGDDCCPPGCNSGNDSDCGVICGNNVKEAGETCDPLSSCPSSCPAMGCQLRELKNAGSCKAVCENSRTQTACASSDDCCPRACNANNDNDCQPRCDNGVVEQGEKCEPLAECTRRQGACRSDRDTIREGRGNAAQCTFECVESPRRCGDADGQCPSGCQNDPDCKRANGSACENAGQCRSNRCTDGRCCTENCGTCEKCTGQGGTCQLPSGTRVCDSRCISADECCNCDLSTRCSGQGQTLVRGVCNNGTCSTELVSVCGECKRCVGAACVNDDNLSGCPSGQRCQAGRCTPEPSPPPPEPMRVTIAVAEYGRSCVGQSDGTTGNLCGVRILGQKFQQRCEQQHNSTPGRCTFTFRISDEGETDPCAGCAKDLFIDWHCARGFFTEDKPDITIGPEAEGTRVTLNCE
jgi:hypothetical protein